MFIDLINRVFNRVGVDEDDNPIMEAVAGFHVNTTTQIASWSQWLITPVTPCRLFWGNTTVCYKFDDEAQFLEQYEAEFGHAYGSLDA